MKIFANFIEPVIKMFAIFENVLDLHLNVKRFAFIVVKYIFYLMIEESIIYFLNEMPSPTTNISFVKKLT